MPFWRRKKDEFVSLGLNTPAAPEPNTAPPSAEPSLPSVAVEPNTAPESSPPAGGDPTVREGANVASRPALTGEAGTSTVREGANVASRHAPPKPVQSRPSTPWQTSVLGLDLSIEQLQAREAALEQEFSARFRRAVSATRESLSQRIDTVFAGAKKIDVELLDQLEEALIAADIGVPTTMHVLETVRRGISRKEIDDIEKLKHAIKSELLAILQGAEKQGVASEANVPENISPYVMMIVGVNGVGKTTTIGKLAQRIKAEGNDVLICAADTFRAAASDQLAIWAERTGVPLIQQKQGTDPAAVLFDSMKAAKARGSDVLIVDTAGRLHNKSNLMAELEKMKRVAGREVEGAPHETLLVVDAVTGQNGLEQARQFLKIAGVTGIVLTKLDGTAKGGIAVAIAKELGLPIRYAGIGEKVDDLVVFDSEQYVNSLFN
jgi:fused signal recognition particle receptor